MVADTKTTRKTFKPITNRVKITCRKDSPESSCQPPTASPARIISLTQSKYTIVDADKYEWLNQWKWYAHWCINRQRFYTLRQTKSHTISMAREILGLKYGDKRQSDHINHRTLDNRILNLRIVTIQQNQWNQENPKGYYWNKLRKKFEAFIKLNGKSIYLGGFETATKARNAYLKAKKRYHKI